LLALLLAVLPCLFLRLFHCVLPCALLATMIAKRKRDNIATHHTNNVCLLIERKAQNKITTFQENNKTMISRHVNEFLCMMSG
jgi:hypothetical protein